MPEIPLRVGRYEIVAPIGEGGMAFLHLAMLRGPFGADKLVVIKHIRPEMVADQRVVAMFEDEARIAVQLNHPNVVHTYEVIAEAGDYYLSMEYLEGRSLVEVLKKIGREGMPLDEHIWILTRVLAALRYAHELTDFNGRPLEIVHRDVSPSNVFITFRGEVKLLDFGIAKTAGAVSTTQQGVIKGKLGYVAPEQCSGRHVDARADIFAVGVMLWEAMARRRRASGDTQLARIQARINNSEPSIEEVWPEAPPRLAIISNQALARNPDLRFWTAQEFQRSLEEHLKGCPRTVGTNDIASLMRTHFRDEEAMHRKIVEQKIAGLQPLVIQTPSDTLPTDENLRPTPVQIHIPAEYQVDIQGVEHERKWFNMRLMMGAFLTLSVVGLGLTAILTRARTREKPRVATQPALGTILPSHSSRLPDEITAIQISPLEPETAQPAPFDNHGTRPPATPLNRWKSAKRIATASTPAIAPRRASARVQASNEPLPALAGARPPPIQPAPVRRTSLPSRVEPGMDLRSEVEPRAARSIYEKDPY